MILVAPLMFPFPLLPWGYPIIGLVCLPFKQNLECAHDDPFWLCCSAGSSHWQLLWNGSGVIPCETLHVDAFCKKLEVMRVYHVYFSKPR